MCAGGPQRGDGTDTDTAGLLPALRSRPPLLTGAGLAVAGTPLLAAA
ncbi:hypothetical protein ABTY61_32180 [Kitasatospora sp. NPDC096128]